MANDDDRKRCLECRESSTGTCARHSPADAAVSRADVVAAFGVLAAVAETIQTLGEIPAGVLFASLQTSIPGMNLQTFDSIIKLLEQSGLVARKPYNRHVIVWTGGEL